MEENERQFLLELTALTRKYGIAITGCGCCGSPALEKAEYPTDLSAGYTMSPGHLLWLEPANEFLWERYSGGIVREEAV